LLRSRAPEEYADSLETSTKWVISTLQRMTGKLARSRLARARGRLRFVDALRALGEGDEETARESLKEACELLPGLSTNGGAVLSHLLFNLPHDGASADRKAQLALAAALWPDPHSRTARVLAEHAASAAEGSPVPSENTAT
jgi:hypothetical protein